MRLTRMVGIAIVGMAAFLLPQVVAVHAPAWLAILTGFGAWGLFIHVARGNSSARTVWSIVAVGALLATAVPVDASSWGATPIVPSTVHGSAGLAISWTGFTNCISSPGSCISQNKGTLMRWGGSAGVAGGLCLAGVGIAAFATAGAGAALAPACLGTIGTTVAVTQGIDVVSHLKEPGTSQVGKLFTAFGRGDVTGVLNHASLWAPGATAVADKLDQGGSMNGWDYFDVGSDLIPWKFGKAVKAVDAGVKGLRTAEEVAKDLAKLEKLTGTAAAKAAAKTTTVVADVGKLSRASKLVKESEVVRAAKSGLKSTAEFGKGAAKGTVKAAKAGAKYTDAALKGGSKVVSIPYRTAKVITYPLRTLKGIKTTSGLMRGVRDTGLLEGSGGEKPKRLLALMDAYCAIPAPRTAAKLLAEPSFGLNASAAAAMVAMFTDDVCSAEFTAWRTCIALVLAKPGGTTDDPACNKLIPDGFAGVCAIAPSMCEKTCDSNEGPLTCGGNPAAAMAACLKVATRAFCEKWVGPGHGDPLAELTETVAPNVSPVVTIGKPTPSALKPGTYVVQVTVDHGDSFFTCDRGEAAVFEKVFGMCVTGYYIQRVTVRPTGTGSGSPFSIGRERLLEAIDAGDDAAFSAKSIDESLALKFELPLTPNQGVVPVSLRIDVDALATVKLSNGSMEVCEDCQLWANETAAFRLNSCLSAQACASVPRPTGTQPRQDGGGAQTPPECSADCGGGGNGTACESALKTTKACLSKLDQSLGGAGLPSMLKYWYVTVPLIVGALGFVVVYRNGWLYERTNGGLGRKAKTPLDPYGKPGFFQRMAAKFTGKAPKPPLRPGYREDLSTLKKALKDEGDGQDPGF